jgi:hypothetical protein
LDTRGGSDIVGKIRIDDFQMLDMSTVESDKCKRTEESPIWSFLVPILEENKIIKRLIFSEEEEDFFSISVCFGEKIHYPIIILESQLGKIVSMGDDVGSQFLDFW